MNLPPFLLETDQIHCYDATGAPVACAGSGQDAARPKHLAHTAPRLQTRGEVVLDALTGAVWTRDANPAAFPLTYEEARAFVADMAANKAHGYTNWRLPPRRLLFSLISHQNVNPTLPSGHPFTNVFTGYYWAAEDSHRFANQGWHIHLGGGRVPRAKKPESSLVWPVCPPPATLPDPGMNEKGRFQPDGACALDQCTGLIWSQDASPVGHPLPWPKALAAVNELNQSAWQGATDWRMPNIRELESLVDLAADSPALTTGHPFRNVADVYWSSTTSLYEPRYAWALYTLDGIIGVGFKTDPGFHLWPVRGG